MKNQSKILIAAAVLALMIWGVYKMRLPRGIRNNNPGNIRMSGSAWVGKVGNDGEFEIFDKMENGVRALTILVSNYYYRHGIKTIRGIINRYAPPTENATDSYVNHVAEKAGVNPDEPLPALEPYLRDIVEAIIYHENGRTIADYDIARGISEAMKVTA